MKCINCGRELQDDAKFCDGCGTSIQTDLNNQQVANNEVLQEQVTINENVVEKQVNSSVEPQSDNQNVQNNISNGQNNKSNKTIFIVIISILIIVVIVLAVLLLTGNKGDNNNNNNTNGNIEDVNNTENIDNNNSSSNNNENNIIDNNPIKKTETVQETKERIISNFDEKWDCTIIEGQCLITIKNNTDEVARVIIQDVNFKDDNEKMIGLERGPIYLSVGPRETGYTTFSKPNLIDNSEKYDNYTRDIFVKSFNYGYHNKDITYTVSKDDENKRFVFNVKNNSDEIIDMFDFQILFYKNDKLVGLSLSGESYSLANEIIEYIKPNEEFIHYINYPYQYDQYYTRGDLLDYDRYEIIVKEAYTYKDDSDLRYRNSHLRK